MHCLLPHSRLWVASSLSCSYLYAADSYASFLFWCVFMSKENYVRNVSCIKSKCKILSNYSFFFFVQLWRIGNTDFQSSVQKIRNTGSCLSWSERTSAWWLHIGEQRHILVSANGLAVSSHPLPLSSTEERRGDGEDLTQLFVPEAHWQLQRPFGRRRRLGNTSHRLTLLPDWY